MIPPLSRILKNMQKKIIIVAAYLLSRISSKIIFTTTIINTPNKALFRI